LQHEKQASHLPGLSTYENTREVNMSIVILCKNCQKSFTTYLSEIQRGRKFCSKSCVLKKRKNNQLKNTNQKRSLVERFFIQISKQNHKNNCWIWEGLKNQQGYGRMRSNYEDIMTHRFSWELHFGEIPKNLWICHHCDNPSCVNPSHLFLGTPQDNAIDRSNKNRNRNQNGSKHNMVKLNEKNVLIIRSELAAGVSGYKLAKKFNVSVMTISNIKLRKNWKHI